MAFVAGPRAVWQISRDKEDPAKRLFLCVKNNLGDDSAKTGLSFGIEPLRLEGTDPPIETSRILWNSEVVTMSADEASADDTTEEESGVLAEAKDFLRELLSLGRVKAQDIHKAAERERHAARTIARAKKSLGIISEREGFGEGSVSYWRLKEDRRDENPSPDPGAWLPQDR